MRTSFFLVGLMLAESIGAYTGWALPHGVGWFLMLLVAMFIALDAAEVVKK